MGIPEVVADSVLCALGSEPGIANLTGPAHKVDPQGAGGRDVARPVQSADAVVEPLGVGSLEAAKRQEDPTGHSGPQAGPVAVREVAHELHMAPTRDHTLQPDGPKLLRQGFLAPEGRGRCEAERLGHGSD